MKVAPMEENKLVVRKVIPASREEVFAAWTDPESMKQWMCPGDVLTNEAKLDVRVGGSYRIVMKSKDKDHDHSGIYQVVDPPSKLVFTWITAGTDQQHATLVTVELFARGHDTELVLTHERFPNSEHVQRYKGGWTTIAEKLAAYFQKHGARRSTGAA
jgi:uncharacterized protein YndB with AHSA1/START domain